MYSQGATWVSASHDSTGGFRDLEPPLMAPFRSVGSFAAGTSKKSMLYQPFVSVSAETVTYFRAQPVHQYAILQGNSVAHRGVMEA